MNKIRLLNQNEINMICAGEIVSNPCSIVKELIENAIDAKANVIKIVLKNGGKTYIEINDNGCGIEKSDIELTVQKHSTSKFTNLDNITNLGFRGEALYAINTTSDLRIISSVNNSGYGYDLNGILQLHNKGTTIIVENLFNNIPARKKFLKTDHQEYQKIFFLINNYAIIYDNIKFTLIHNDKIHGFHGKDDFYRTTQSTPEKFLYENGNFKMSGYICKYSVKHKYLIAINNRIVNNFAINRLIQNIYGEISGKQDLSYILLLQIPYDTIDVNIHPSKTEIRFHNEQYILDFIATGFRNILNITPKITIEDVKIDSICENVSQKKVKYQLQDSKDNVLEDLYNERTQLHELKNIIDEYCDHNMEKKVEKKQIQNEQLELKNNSLDLGNSIGQVFCKYIITQSNNHMFIVDQHAAAERILSETIKNSLTTHKMKLLKPIVKNINYEINIDMQQQLNILFDYTICDNRIIINSIPSLIPEKLIHNIINILDNISIKKSILDIIHDYGCRNSLKAGTKLTIEEMNKLIDTLELVNNAEFCNHGRPVFQKLTIDYIDKLFRRKL